jgi:hypothetical protein
VLSKQEADAIFKPVRPSSSWLAPVSSFLRGILVLTAGSFYAGLVPLVYSSSITKTVAFVLGLLLLAGIWFLRVLEPRAFRHFRLGFSASACLNLMFFLVGAAVATAIWSRLGAAAFKDAQAEMAKEGFFAAVQPLGADQSEQNGAVRLLRILDTPAFKGLNPVHGGRKQPRYWQIWTTNTPADSDLLSGTRPHRADYRLLSGALNDALSAPSFEWPSQGSRDFFRQLVYPHTAEWLALARANAVEAVLEAKEGRRTEASRCLNNGLELGRRVQKIPYTFSAVVAVTIETVTLQAGIECLRISGAIETGWLDSLRANEGKTAVANGLEREWVEEPAAIFGMDWFQPKHWSFSRLADFIDYPLFGFDCARMVRRNLGFLKCLREQDLSSYLCLKDLESRHRAVWLLESIGSSPHSTLLARGLALDANERVTLLSAKIFAYHSAHRKWPANLTEVEVPQDMPFLKLDPYSSAPLTYQIENGRPTLESPGMKHNPDWEKFNYGNPVKWYL